MIKQFLRCHSASKIGVKGDKSIKIFKNSYVALKIHYKTYPRFKKIRLGKTLRASELERLLKRRKTRRVFSNNPISLKGISHLLYYSCGISDRTNERRMYPSAGARYPIETYVCVKNTPKMSPGLYHYNVKDNALEFLLKDRNLVSFKKCLVKGAAPKKATVFIILSAMFNRNYAKYTERGYRYSLIESGHIGQNISIISEEFGFGCCAVGGFIDDKINEYLDVDPSKEAVVYVLCLGKL